MSQYSVDFTLKGPVAPETADVLSAVQEYWQKAFDNRLNPDMATPQGQIITSESAIIQDKNNQMLLLAQQFDPAQAEGRFQDALASIYFITRQPARATVVQCYCTGLANVLIPGADTSDDPAIVKDEHGNEFYCQKSVRISGGGNTFATFVARETGPLEVEAHSITNIVNAIPGWDTVDNLTAGVTGQNVETRRAFELRRQASVALNSRSMLASVYAEVGQLDGVIDLLARQNRGDTPKTEGGITMGPHSIYIAVLGGEDMAVAEAMYNSVSGGCDYNGNTAVQYKDTVTGAVETVLFERPSELVFKVHVTMRANANTPADIVRRIRENVFADFYGEEYPNVANTYHRNSDDRVHIGETVYASRFYCPVLAAGATDVLGITLQAGSDPAGMEATLRYDQYPSLVMEDVTVEVVS